MSKDFISIDEFNRHGMLFDYTDELTHIDCSEFKWAIMERTKIATADFVPDDFDEKKILDLIHSNVTPEAYINITGHRKGKRSKLTVDMVENYVLKCSKAFVDDIFFRAHKDENHVDGQLGEIELDLIFHGLVHEKFGQPNNVPGQEFYAHVPFEDFHQVWAVDYTPPPAPSVVAPPVPAVHKTPPAADIPVAYEAPKPAPVAPAKAKPAPPPAPQAVLDAAGKRQVVQELGLAQLFMVSSKQAGPLGDIFLTGIEQARRNSDYAQFAMVVDAPTLMRLNPSLTRPQAEQLVAVWTAHEALQTASTPEDQKKAIAARQRAINATIEVRPGFRLLMGLK